VSELIDVLTNWTGKPSGEPDDDIDALSGLCDLLRMGTASTGAVDFRVPGAAAGVRFGASSPGAVQYMPIG
jgi:hypothetical protein